MTMVIPSVRALFRMKTAVILIPKVSNTGAGLKPCNCTDSPYGRTVYIKPDYDPRLFPPVSRNSDAFKKMLKRRTTVERSHKRMFKDYDIEAGNCRSARERFTRATMSAINVHLDAWIKHTRFSVISLIKGLA